jgi:[glutamine synthetase] adenylyltransferase / [glutamine synthetase]-adenylyl-L-tyrosine phosphorylase
MQTLIDGVEFRDPSRARFATETLGKSLPEESASRIQHLLALAPDPDAAIRFLQRLRQESPAAFDRISNSPAALRYALTLFSYSNFLAEAVIRDPEQLLALVSSGSFYRVLTAEEFEERLADSLGRDNLGAPAPVDLARFRRRQLLRIALRDVLGAGELAEVTLEISSLADAILDLTYRRVRSEFVAKYGEPRLPDGQPCGFSVISLGKLGGKELNYSSDIDLMFVYSGNGETNGPQPVTNKEFYKKVANEYTALLSAYTAEGQCYRVDLRLRPDGALGEICLSVEGAAAYYAERARDWEKQMLIKARVSAGETEPGTALLDSVEPLIYQSSLDFRAVEAVSETRQRIHEKAAAKRGLSGGLDVKLAPGGIRDIEFLAQCLQRLHGGREQWVRHGGTMFALFRLRDKHLLSAGEYARLTAAYEFLRNLEHRLQILDDRQTHSLPVEQEDLDLLARRMPRDGAGQAPNGDALLQKLAQHLANVQEIYERVIHAQKPMQYELETREPEQRAQEPEAPRPLGGLIRFLEQRAPQLAEVVGNASLHRGRERLEHFLERASFDPAVLLRLNSDPGLAAGVLDLFEYSPYFADELLRDPELLDEIGKEFEPLGEPVEDGAALRRFYRRQMFRIQSESILRSAPIFATLAKTSVLADSVIAAAYRIARNEATPPSSPSYSPQDQMMTIALGRLGMREFDLGSDADLVFVIPDADAGELLFWTGVAERMIYILSSYTGEGVLFAIDTRLRPNGREGDLVQTESAYKAYFAEHAEAWEGITYMKTRAVAGNVERATEFLHKLQDVDWRRYGQSRRSRTQLAEMRSRLEKEQAARNPLKAGEGGYYDIDFALMYLRLKGAGIFYKVLNTPERIDVIEQMGHLDPEDADFLREAATFYRAIDHGLRVSTGHAEGSLPAAEGQLEVLTNLVRRWAPASLEARRLDAALRDIRRRTREFFDHVFERR